MPRLCYKRIKWVLLIPSIQSREKSFSIKGEAKRGGYQMKSIKFFRILSVAVILSLLMVTLPAAPALAAEDIALDPDEGEVGERFYVEGDGFDESDYTDEENPDIEEVDIYFSSQEADEGDDIDSDVDIYERLVRDEEIDEDGEFRKRVTVPDELTDGDEDEDVVRGTYYVYVTYDGRDRIEAVAEFEVIAAGMTIDPDDGPVGTEVEIAGTDFAGNDEITVEYDGVPIDIDSGDDETNSSGDFDSTIIIPEGTAGDHTITVIDESDKAVDAVFTVEPASDISVTSGMIGDSVTVSGTGFGDRVDVTVTFDGDDVATGSTDTDGNFSITFKVPVTPSGTHDIEVEDEDNNSGTAEFTIAAATFSLGTTTGNIGTEITISGTGFKSKTTVTITYATEPIVVATPTTDASGSFAATFKAPPSQHGDHVITASDGENTLTTIFTMESTAPPIPVPQLPEMEIKAEQPVSFDWGDVTDPSGVTYTFQLAKDKNFTDIVLEKERTESEYTMTEEEELESTKKEAPYWWRVKAIDGAANESGWTTPGSFHVGFVFAMPTWVIYLLFALGGLGLFFVGFWLGRRISYAY